MKYFQRLAHGIDVGGLAHSAQVQWAMMESEFDMLRRKQAYHGEIETRTLRGPLLSSNEQSLATSIYCMNYPAFAKVPQARRLVFGLMAQVEGEQLGRVMIVRSSPGSNVIPHSDFVAGASPQQMAIFYNRYHVILASGPGCLFTCGDEQVQMNTGELWWFDNTVVHGLENNSAEERMHLVVDIHTSHFGYEPRV